MLQSLTDPVGCIGGPINYLGNERTTTIERPAKRGRESEIISEKQKHQISSDGNCCQFEAGQFGIILNPNPVSIGLKLSYEEEEHNASVTCASDNKAAVSPMLAIGISLKAEIDRQQQEFDHQVRLQEDNMRKGMRELGERQTISFLSAIETGIGKKLHEKEVEIQNMNRRNNELVERIKQISTEVQSWQCRAKYNESVVNALKSNLKQVLAQGVIQRKEGCGDSEVDSAASYAYENHWSILEANSVTFKRQMVCRACKTKEASILLLPCRHLCLCKDCAGSVDACPICQILKTAGVEVFTS
ncbi:probable BOI-related E3 ubiquitin-protein ligase 3 isoform X2 [Ricinus communis]|uniref:ATP binding protein, putative n=1 Tax=Ricinus communis TaxID=3988 RepID=B9RB10_RICCO|nr:probable BOI-related E3 ubiquitin-protein ligase 3 isoform X2 [Ricinus communis]XP_015577809.1 probable BOI-related E3 ubiquitin-protein ligase 3 isoform X2 [Ricinus communis]EEF51987.1 ATP binding protein, putative [Ricinus communis]|eukprot:XP_002511385.1 probable BOI-related E3 ubiquitin-protein ligase 3 isoform X2 [Ricinus communis]